MSDSDDDMPPPLDDMSAKLEAMQIQKKKNEKANPGLVKRDDDEGEEIRLKPKTTGTSVIKQSTEEIKEVPKVVAQQPAAAKPQSKAAGGFGGMKAGFFNQAPPKRKAVAAPAKPLVEDVTHVKAQPNQERLKINEVQDAMADTLIKQKDQWLTPEFMQKLMAKPHLMAAFQSPQFQNVLADMQKDPKAAYAKYGDSPELKSFMEEFGTMMGTHFDSLADTKKKEEEQAKLDAEKKKREEEEELKKDPIYDKIHNDPEVKAALEDPKVQLVIQKIQKEGGLDFHSVARSDPETANKLMLLINKGVFNTQTTLPGQ